MSSIVVLNRCLCSCYLDSNQNLIQIKLSWIPRANLGWPAKRQWSNCPHKNQSWQANRTESEPEPSPRLRAFPYFYIQASHRLHRYISPRVSESRRVPESWSTVGILPGPSPIFLLFYAYRSCVDLHVCSAMFWIEMCFLFMCWNDRYETIIH